MKSILSIIALLWLVNWVYDSLYFFHENEMATYTEMCPFDFESRSFPKSCNKKVIHKTLYKVFPEEQLVVVWNGVMSRKYANCIIKDRENFVCRDKNKDGWDILVQDEMETPKPDEIDKGYRNVWPVQYWYYNIKSFISKVIV